MNYSASQTSIPDPFEHRIAELQDALRLARKALMRWDNIALSHEAVATINNALDRCN
ncbi:MAG TPA: hypothetical protein VK110_06795 [Salinisphaeraceae bacterium]|nr:hypothetical protein [Salinisphaeraceae bacterium]